jgi:L-ribulokinase
MRAMSDDYLIGLDFGTESARGILIETRSGEAVASHAHAYRHGVMTHSLPDGTKLPPGWALQDAADYTAAAAELLSRLGRDKTILGIGIDFTASSPLPARADGTPLSALFPARPHAYVKLWKHRAAQPWADRINAKGGAYLNNCGGKLSGEWLLAKAAQLAEEAPDLWEATERFIEGGDWLVWQLTGNEARSLGLAAYKAQYQAGSGYPSDVVPHLGARLGPGEPIAIGASAGSLSEEWRRLTGIRGQPAIATAVIDSHVVMPAVGAVQPGVLVIALGTSAVCLLLDDRARPLPQGIEGVAEDGVLPGFWCYEAGQPAVGDTLAWFVRTFPHSGQLEDDFAWYNDAAAELTPGENHLLALDWWNGNRVPYGDAALSGLVVGMRLDTAAHEIYRSLLESICFGARAIVDRFVEGGVPINRVILTSGLAQNNPLLVQLMADVLGRDVEVPRLVQPTAVGAAIHGAVAAKVVADYAEGAARFGARDAVQYRPRNEAIAPYERLYAEFRALSQSPVIHRVMHALDG